MMNESIHHRLKDPAYWYCISLSALMTLLGIVLGIGGLWLITLGKSWYDAIAGLGLVISGTGLTRASYVGMWAYLLTYLFSLGWAFWGVETDWPSLAPRLVAPIVLLASIFICISLSRPPSDAHGHGRAATMAAFLVVAAGGFLLTASGSLSVVVGEVSTYIDILPT